MNHDLLLVEGSRGESRDDGEGPVASWDSLMVDKRLILSL